MITEPEGRHAGALEGWLEDWHVDLVDALTRAAYDPGGLDLLSRVTRRYRRMFREPILASIEAMIEVWQGN